MMSVENGSPSSLKSAASNLRKGQFESEESEKVLLAVITGILRNVWPSERIEWEVPVLSVETPYMGAIKSAEEGIYDESTGNVDFLTNLLPSLVLLKIDSVSEIFEKSRKDLSEALRESPESVLANYLSGILYLKNGMAEKSLPYFQTAVNNAPGTVQIIEKYVMALKMAGQVKESYNIAFENLRKFPSNVELLKFCAENSYELGLYEESEDYIARVLQQVPNDLQALLFRAKVLVKSQNYIRAASLLDMYSRQDDSSRDYLILRSQIQNDWSKNTSGAVATIEKALKLYPEDVEVMLFASKLCVEAGVTVAGKNVVYYAEKVLEKHPDNQEALSYICEGFIQNKDWNKAYEAAKKLLASKNVPSSRVLDYVNICISLKKNDEAYQYVLPVYKENPDDENLIQAYINILMATGRKSEVSVFIRELLNTGSSKLKSFLYYKKSFLESNQDLALADLRSSLISNPRNIDSLFSLYTIYFNKKDYRKAQYYLKQIVALKPNDSMYRQLNEELSHLVK